MARALLQLEGFAVVGEAADALSAWTRSGGCDRMWWWCSTSSFPTLLAMRLEVPGARLDRCERLSSGTVLSLLRTADLVRAG